MANQWMKLCSTAVLAWVLWQQNTYLGAKGKIDRREWLRPEGTQPTETRKGCDALIEEQIEKARAVLSRLNRGQPYRDENEVRLDGDGGMAIGFRCLPDKADPHQRMKD